MRTIPVADFCKAAKKLMEDRVAKCAEQKGDTIVPNPKDFEERCMQYAANVAVDADIGPKCLASFEKHGANWEGLIDRLDECRRVYVGRLAVGAKCGGDEECSGENLCLHDKCVAPQAAGAECKPSLWDGRTGCVAGFRCHDDKEEKDTCRKVAALGEACDDAECPFGANCVDGTCAARGDVGAPCHAWYECKQDLGCLKKKADDVDGKCAPLRRDGESCEDRSDCVSDLCGDDHKCHLRCGFGG